MSLQSLDQMHPVTVFNEVCKSYPRGLPGLVRTPSVRSYGLDGELGCELTLKLENLQATGAFKERGALVKLMSLSEEQSHAGVIAASAGNHAQGVARHAARFGIQATIVMPVSTPKVKTEATAQLGAEVILKGADFDAANAWAQTEAERSGKTFVHPFDDPHIIAGQATATRELLQDTTEIQDLIVPIGGGGLCAGAALALQKDAPEIRLYGVRSEFYPSIEPGEAPKSLPPGGATLAEGLAVKVPGVLSGQLLRSSIADTITVTERHLERALCLLLTKQNIVAEGAGAAGVAAILARPDLFKGRRVATLVCGGNIDPRLLSSLLMRDLARSQRLARLRVQLLDLPGQLVSVSTAIAEAGGNVIDVAYHKTFSDLPAKVTYIDLSIETKDGEQMQGVIDHLKASGFVAEPASY